MTSLDKDYYQTSKYHRPHTGILLGFFFIPLPIPREGIKETPLRTAYYDLTPSPSGPYLYLGCMATMMAVRCLDPLEQGKRPTEGISQYLPPR